MDLVLVPAMNQDSLFGVAFKSFCINLNKLSFLVTFLRCLKECDILSDDLISQISSSITKGSVHVGITVVFKRRNIQWKILIRPREILLRDLLEWEPSLE